MRRVPKYSVKKTAAMLQKRDRFYLAGKKYCVIGVIEQPNIKMDNDNNLFRFAIDFVEVDKSLSVEDTGMMIVSSNMEFLILTGESGIGKKAFDSLDA